MFHPLHCWFLYWIILYNTIYASFQSSNDGQEGDDATTDLNNSTTNQSSLELDSHEAPVVLRKLPAPLFRAGVYGILCCGILMGATVVLLSSGFRMTLFWAMPLVQGSLISDTLFFYAGIVAKENKWLEGDIDLQEQIGVPIPMLQLFAVVEGLTMVYTFHLLSLGDGNLGLYLLVAFISAGLYVIDMSLVVVHTFQAFFDYENEWTKYFKDAAYATYVIHFLVVIFLQVVFAAIYDNIAAAKLEWDSDGNSSTLLNPVVHIATWLLCNVAAQCLVWPLASRMRNLPYLNNVL